MAKCGKVVSMRPSAFYARKALNYEVRPTKLRAIGLHLVAENERLREWIRAQGLIPPKWKVLPEEAKAKGMMDQPDADIRPCDDCEGC